MSKLRVLLIDDDELVRATISNCLLSAGYEVAQAADGKLGLAAFKAGRCDLVIVDILMPEKEGIETIREMRQLDGALPIIAISGGGKAMNVDFLTAAKAFGATATLAKPFSRDVLLERVAEALRHDRRRAGGSGPRATDAGCLPPGGSR